MTPEQTPKRPQPGTKTQRIIRVPVCAECGYVIATNLCSDECGLDGMNHDGSTIFAVYERVETFLRDER